ncbi:hypothetical protein ACH4C6_33645 [Streptomyces sp. NPDC017943]|uniref:hypothetical protein n=1 Tax=Streptomyces sp. NPDC017943 TaxID=3365019 RepID=UPI0037A502D8
MVNGRRCVSPQEDEANGAPPTGRVVGLGPADGTAGEHGPEPVPSGDLLGVYPPAREGIPGEALPDVPDEAYPADSRPLDPPEFAPLDDAPADEGEESEQSDRSDSTASKGRLVCADCGRPIKSERALNSQGRQVHPEG